MNNISPPPALASNERLRGFYTDSVVETINDAVDMNDYVTDALIEMQQSDTATRVSIRAVVDIGLIPFLTPGDETVVEAAIPIRDTGFALAYIGDNESGRRLDQAMVTRHTDLLDAAILRASTGQVPKATIYVVDPANTQGIEEDFETLYRALNFDPDETGDILSNRDNTIVYARLGNQVVSTAMAERESYSIDGFGQLNLVEITEASTLPQYRGQGLYRTVSGHLIRHIKDLAQSDPSSIDVVYGESNLTMPGVIHAAHANGRRFNHFDRDRFGLAHESFGILPQNFSVNDGVETRPYNDFAVSYVPLGGHDE